jgi:hypothetical protein
MGGPDSWVGTMRGYDGMREYMTSKLCSKFFVIMRKCDLHVENMRIYMPILFSSQKFLPPLSHRMNGH